MQPLPSSSDAGSSPAAREQRAHPRSEVMRRGVVVHQPSGRTYPCLIVDISGSGARLQLFAPKAPTERLTLLDPTAGTAHELRVAWRMGWLMGVAFVRSLKIPQA